MNNEAFQRNHFENINWLFDLADSFDRFLIIKNLDNEIIYINKPILRFLGFNHTEIGNYNDFFNKILFSKYIYTDKRMSLIELNTKYGIKSLFTVTNNNLINGDSKRIGIIGMLNFFDISYDVNFYCKDFFYEINKRLDVMEKLDIGVVIFNNKLKLKYINGVALRYFGESYIDLYNNSIVDVLKKWKSDINIFDILTNGIKIYRIDKENETKFLSIEIFSTGNKNEQILVIKDISEKIRLYNLLEKTEKYNVMGQLAASTIHEIKNSVTSIKGFIQLMQMKSNSNSLYYESMLSESDRIIDLTKNYLGIIKNEKKLDIINLKDAIGKYMIFINAEAIRRKIKIIKKLDDVKVKIDYNHLKQILLNIFQNAFEAIGENGNIYLTTRFNNFKNKAIIRIVDNGCGIDRKDLKNIMKPLYTTKKEGTGLGLSVCKNILDIYKGEIKILSKKGCGTIVNIYLNAEK